MSRIGNAPITVPEGVEINISDSYFSELLKDKKNGIIIRSESSSFLVELKKEIEKQVVTMAKKS